MSLRNAPSRSFRAPSRRPGSRGGAHGGDGRSRVRKVRRETGSMILAVISGTPCVVMPNSNHKIAGTHRAWPDGRPGTAFLENPSAGSVLLALDKLREARSSSARHLGLSRNVDSLRKAMTEALP